MYYILSIFDIRYIYQDHIMSSSPTEEV